MKYKFIHIIIVSIATCILSSCYQEQHFDMPGPYDEREIVPDTLPFSFDTTRQAGMWLIKDGVPDYSKIAFNGWSDFRPEFGDTTVWQEKNGGFTSLQCFNINGRPTFGGTTGNDFVKQSYSHTFLYAKPFVKFGPGVKWYFYVKMSLPYITSSAPYFILGTKNGTWSNVNVMGIDAAAGANGMPSFYVMMDGNLVNQGKMPLITEFTTPGEPFELEIICDDLLIYAKINGKLLWIYNLPPYEYEFPLAYLPWRNAVTFYDIYMEGDIKERYDFVCHEEEKDYRTIQAPALTKASNGDILLFAEGRVANNELTSNADHAKLRTNATDIVMKRSSDGGDTWSELKAIVGERKSVNISPVAITDEDDKHYLLYTKDNSGHLDGSAFEIHQITSTNNGDSWSRSQEITSSLQGEYTQRTISSHGIELKGRANVGRLVAITSCVKTGVNTLAAIYSDDKGASWKSGSVVDATAITSGNVVELSDGRLMLIMSHNGTTTKCQQAYSSDGGATWSTPEYGTLSTGERGYRYSGSTVTTADGKMLHFTPSKQKGNSTGFIDGNLMRINGCPQYGEGLGVTISSDNGATWSNYESMVTQAYENHLFLCKSMDAVVLNDGRVLCITEGGVQCPKEGLIRFYK